MIICRVFGSYAALKGGTVGEALEDFTGGILEYIDLANYNEEQQNIFELLLNYQTRCSLMGCSIKVNMYFLA